VTAKDFMEEHKLADDTFIFENPAIQAYVEDWHWGRMSISTEKQFKDLIRMIYFIGMNTLAGKFDAAIEG